MASPPSQTCEALPLCKACRCESSQVVVDSVAPCRLRRHAPERFPPFQGLNDEPQCTVRGYGGPVLSDYHAQVVITVRSTSTAAAAAHKLPTAQYMLFPKGLVFC